MVMEAGKSEVTKSQNKIICMRMLWWISSKLVQNKTNICEVFTVAEYALIMTSFRHEGDGNSYKFDQSPLPKKKKNCQTLCSSTNTNSKLYKCESERNHVFCICIRLDQVNQECHHGSGDIWCLSSYDPPPIKATPVAAEWLRVSGNQVPMIAWTDATFPSTWTHYISPEGSCHTFPPSD